MEAVLDIDHVSKSIQGKTIIHDLAFTVFAGEVFGFLGPNGAGKTTTIRMMVGLSSPDSGDIRIHGHSIQKAYKQAIAHVGAIVENPELYTHLTAEQNLVHFARMNGKVDKDRIQELLRLVRLENVKNKRVRTFSLGMKQRLGIAQALIHRPKLLILDEPTNGLDPEGIRMVRDYLRQLAKEEGLAVVVSSHLMSEMELMCDRFAILQEGHLVDIEQTSDESNEDTRLTYRLEFTPGQQSEAQHAIHAFDPSAKARLQGDHIFASFYKTQLPDLIRHLSSEAIDMYELREEKVTLEDRFLSVTSRKEASS
ncbi:ABC transporter ATP-binding protein [Aureibacillus halotolerans]|uniref:ABC-2 type transport system ATP-binding protein n=1 Tax=Aureibacillus halotolerans TaxID=1508390 RepID=A0A4R6U7B3_9BACI|nr:ABC transporter ATP-binding protein [Aureibacillus halotolerans]TDQ40793.1 ABC-2 type transport system ATP-binding protein [Aureibacillus halotolerans]